MLAKQVWGILISFCHAYMRLPVLPLYFNRAVSKKVESMEKRK